jgi:enamine deaminase RidA (YjgF/YER057c/UK114 family)
MSSQQPERDANDRRAFFGQATVGLASGSLAVCLPAACLAAGGAGPVKRRGLFPDGAPAAAPGYSPGICAEGRQVVFVSGQGPKDLKADPDTQIRQTFDRIGLVLKEAGASFQHVAMLRAYFVHMQRDLPIYRKVRTDYLVKPYPASTAVGVTELAIPGLEIEIEAVAIVS